MEKKSTRFKKVRIKIFLSIKKVMTGFHDVPSSLNSFRGYMLYFLKTVGKIVIPAFFLKRYKIHKNGKSDSFSLHYSLRRAETGSFLEAFPAGIQPPRRVRQTLRIIRIMAPGTGKEALTIWEPVR